MKVYELKKILASLPEEADDEYIEIHSGDSGNICDGLCGVVYDPLSYHSGVHFYGYGWEGTCVEKEFLKAEEKMEVHNKCQ